MISGGSETVFHIGPWIGYGLALLGALALVWASFEFASADSRFNIVLLVGGGLIGWVMGVLLTPGLANQTSFSPYGTAILAFVGGYVVGKFDRIFDLSFRQPGDIDVRLAAAQRLDQRACVQITRSLAARQQEARH